MREIRFYEATEEEVVKFCKIAIEQQINTLKEYNSNDLSPEVIKTVMDFYKNVPLLSKEIGVMQSLGNLICTLPPIAHYLGLFVFIIVYTKSTDEFDKFVEGFKKLCSIFCEPKS